MHTDIRDASEVWLAMRRDDGEVGAETTKIVRSTVELLLELLNEMPDDERSHDVRRQLEAIREIDFGYSRYHIQGAASTRQIAIEMCRDDTYLIGPLPINVVLPHDRTEWPGLHFPLKEN